MNKHCIIKIPCPSIELAKEAYLLDLEYAKKCVSKVLNYIPGFSAVLKNRREKNYPYLNSWLSAYSQRPQPPF